YGYYKNHKKIDKTGQKRTRERKEYTRGRDVPNDVIKLMMFPYSLEGGARVWYDKEPPNSMLTWDDLVNKFVNQFFPPSKTTHLKNKISRFTQRFEETFGEAWERFKEILRAYSLNAVTGENLLSKTTREALNIIENKSKVRYSRYKANVSRMNTNSRENASKTDDRIDKLVDQISTLVDIFAKKVVTPATVKVVEESCVTCGGNHAYSNCDATNNDQSSVCAVVKRETEETTDKEQTNFQGSTAHIQPLVVPIPEPDVSKTLPKPNIIYPSRLNDQKLREKATNQMEKNGCMSRLGRSWREHKSYASFHMEEAFLTQTTPTQMTLELADRSITRPKGVAEDIFVKVGKFHFPTDFVVVDFEADPRVPLILGRSFLRTGRALIDVYGEEITLRVNDEVVTFNLNQTTGYSSTYDYMSVNRIDVIDVAREEYAQEMLGFSKNSSGSNPTSTSEPIISDSSYSLTSFEGSDFILKEIEAYLKDKSISPDIDHAECDPEGDICLIKKLLNDDPFQLPPMDLKQGEVAKAKSSIEEPPKL
nr:reverse transcriptase domain-containing protein [Tanacetum cinerariifolium]